MSSSHPILGKVIEICIATKDLTKTVRELASYGIGPWQIYTFDSKDNISDATMNGRAAEFRLRVGFAQLTKEIAYEVIEPLDTEENDIFYSWLQARNGQSGIHHIAYDCDNVAWEDRFKRFEVMGAEFVQGGVWHGKQGICQFAWFRKPQQGSAQDLGSTSTFFETIKFSDDWEDPAPESTM